MDLLIRQARPDDGSTVSRIYAPYIESTAITFEEHPVDTAAMTRRIEETLQTHPYLVAESSGQVIGYAYAGSHSARASYRWSVNVAIYLDRSWRGKGIGKSLYGALLPLLTNQGFVMACAGITLPNAASVALHESMGFNQIATYHNIGFKLGAWRDVGWWERKLMVPPQNPAEPRAWKNMPGFEAISAG